MYFITIYALFALKILLNTITLKYIKNEYIKNKQEKNKLKYTCSLNESAQKEPDWNT